MLGSGIVSRQAAAPPRVGPTHWRLRPDGPPPSPGCPRAGTFAPFDPFVPIETTGASLGGLYRLTVQDDHRRAGQAAAAQARLLMKRPLQFGQDARIFPGTKVMVNGRGGNSRLRVFAGNASHFDLAL